jgi:hypothetical protein
MMTLDHRLKDKWWRLTHLYKVKDKTGSLVTFQPNQTQLRHLAERGSHRYNYVLKYRQGGITTLYCIDYLDEALWVPGMSCAIIAHEQKFNEKIFSIVRRAHDNLPDQIKPQTKTNTKYSYEFTHLYTGHRLDSGIYVSADVRSGTVLKLHITEAAWIKDRAKIDAGAKQAVPKTGSITEETTANGFNEFFDKYDEALKLKLTGRIGDQDYLPHFYAWFEDPEYTLPGTMTEILESDQAMYGDENLERITYGLTDGQLLWRRWKINELRQSKGGIGLSGLQLFRQEYPSNIQEAFQSGAGNVFDIGTSVGQDPLTRSQALTQLTEFGYNPAQIAEMIKTYDELVKIGVVFWVMPRPKVEYVMGGDPSDGTGSDFGPLDVWHNHEQVAQFYGKVRPDILAEYAAKIGNFYNKAFIGIENNMLTCVLELSKIYDNYFYEPTIDKKTKKKTKRLGYRTSAKTRDPMIDKFIELWEDGDLIIRSGITFSEMKTFVKKEGGKREHADGKHDDTLFAGFIAQQMIILKPKKAKGFATKAF